MAIPTENDTYLRDNNFNFLRLFFASIVILGHSPELVDGDRHREILTRIFHSLSLGELAVDGFFLLSGFLIVQSWERQPAFSSFFKKRALRIYPGFIVATCVSAFIVGPLGSNPLQYFSHFNIPLFLVFLVFLLGVATPPVFVGQPYPATNGPLWTITHEFRCYMLVAILGSLGIFKKRRSWLILTVIILACSLFPDQIGHLTFRGSWYFFGSIPDLFRLVSLFFVGGCFYLFKDVIRYKPLWGFVAIPAFFACLLRVETAHLGVATLGAYILFWIAFTPLPVLSRFKTSHDISYGIYLYGWPTQKLLLWYIPALSPWLLFPIALALSSACGLVSWHWVERPFLRLKYKKPSLGVVPETQG